MVKNEMKAQEGATSAKPETRNSLEKRRTIVGIVVSDKMQKTIVVQIKRKALHPEYGKVINKANKFKVHDEKNEAKIGDKVRIVETRPLSRDKCWRLVEILGHGEFGVGQDIKEVEAVAPVKAAKKAVTPVAKEVQP